MHGQNQSEAALAFDAFLVVVATARPTRTYRHTYSAVPVSLCVLHAVRTYSYVLANRLRALPSLPSSPLFLLLYFYIGIGRGSFVLSI